MYSMVKRNHQVSLVISTYFVQSRMTKIVVGESGRPKGKDTRVSVLWVVDDRRRGCRWTCSVTWLACLRGVGLKVDRATLKSLQSLAD